MKQSSLTAFCASALVALALTGCGSTYHVYKENLNLLFSSSDKQGLSWDSVSASQFDLISVDTGDNAGTMALAFLEHQQHKFIGADNSFLILHHGRMIRSSGFVNDILHHSVTTHKSENVDPLSSVSQQSAMQLSGVRWQFAQLNEDGNTTLYDGLWSDAALTSVQVLGHKFSVLYFTERVTSSDGRSFTNEYWFSQDGKTLLQTKQRIAPTSTPIQIVFISRLNRLRERGGPL